MIPTYNSSPVPHGTGFMCRQCIAMIGRSTQNSRSVPPRVEGYSRLGLDRRSECRIVSRTCRQRGGKANEAMSAAADAIFGATESHILQRLDARIIAVSWL